MFRPKLWVRTFIRKKFNFLIWGSSKSCVYLREFPWLKQFVPFRYDLLGSTGIENGVSIRRVSAYVLNIWAARRYRPYSQIYLVNREGHVFASHRRRLSCFFSGRETVHDTLCKLGGRANLVKYIVCMSLSYSRKWHIRSAAITIFKFPADVVPLEYAAKALAELEAKLSAERAKQLKENEKAAAKNTKANSKERAEVLQEIASLDTAKIR